MKPVDPPEAKYIFAYRDNPRSGNEINGLGESRFRQARHVFHGKFGAAMDWAAMDHFFTLINAIGVVWHMMMIRWALRRAEGPVAKQKVHFGTLQEASAHVKAKGSGFGAVKMGITTITEETVYEGRFVPWKGAIILALPMDREEMAHAPHDPAAVEVMRAYRAVAEMAVKLADHIRAMGWEARAYGDPNSTDVLHIPLAVNAGIGQLGKHGSLICEEYGSNIRLVTVVTDLPLEMDEPADIGVDDFCLNCKICSTQCPPKAIHNEQKLVRGKRKWYVDFDKCVPYFAKTKGCAICIQVCPWSETGRGIKISKKMLTRRDAVKR